MYFPKGFKVDFVPRCPECEIIGSGRNYFKVIFTEDKLYKPITLRVVGYLQ